MGSGEREGMGLVKGKMLDGEHLNLRTGSEVEPVEFPRRRGMRVAEIA